jgi:hypothetical protein
MKKIFLIHFAIMNIISAGFSATNDVTITNTNYNGDVVRDIYRVFGTGFEVVEKNSARVEVGVKTTRSLPAIRTADDPVGAYETTPTGETADTDYNERTLTMTKAMLYEEIDPVVWHDIWEPFASQGMTFTNLALNPEIASAVFELYENAVGRQFSKLFWQGNTGSGDLIDGIITLATADASVIDVTPAGVITESNVIDIVSAVWDAIPDQFFEDPDYSIHMNTSDYKLLQRANQTAADSTSGYLSNSIKDMFLSHRIKHYAGLPKNYIVAGKGTTGMESNFVFGFYATPDEELGAPIIDKISNNSRDMFVRVDWKIGVQYREGSEIVLYSPA